MSVVGELSETITLSAKLYDGATNQHPQVTVYNSDGSVNDTLNLVHTTSGIYTNTWSSATEGYFQADYIVYSDASHTIKNTNYIEGSETIWVTEGYGGGGGGGLSYVIQDKKSPWTYQQKEVARKQIEDIYSILVDMQRELYKEGKKRVANHEETKSTINKRLMEFDKSIKQISNSDLDKMITQLIDTKQSIVNAITNMSKKSSEKSIKQHNNQIKLLRDYNEQIKLLRSGVKSLKSKTISRKDIDEMSNRIDYISNMIVKLLSDEELEEFVHEHP